MASKRKPVVRAWRVPATDNRADSASWRGLLVDGVAWVWWPPAPWTTASMAAGDPVRTWRVQFEELPTSEARRLNAQRIKEMGRKP